MKRLSVLVATFLLAAGVLSGCAPTESADTNAASSAASSSEPASAAPAALPALSSDSASSDTASSDSASSDSASSDSASSNSASSNKSSEPVLSGPSGISEMNVSMNYISDADVLAALGSKDMVVIDLRKPADAKAGHIQGAIFAPMNKAVDNNNYADAIANITGALYDATGNEVGEGKKLVLACYAGKKYAQAATDILNALGADMDNVYTLQGGMTAWNEAGNPTVAD